MFGLHLTLILHQGTVDLDRSRFIQITIAFVATTTLKTPAPPSFKIGFILVCFVVFRILGSATKNFARAPHAKTNTHISMVWCDVVKRMFILWQYRMMEPQVHVLACLQSIGRHCDVTSSWRIHEASSSARNAHKHATKTLPRHDALSTCK